MAPNTKPAGTAETSSADDTGLKSVWRPNSTNVAEDTNHSVIALTSANTSRMMDLVLRGNRERPFTPQNNAVV
jgi:hypothetical protein